MLRDRAALGTFIPQRASKGELVDLVSAVENWTNEALFLIGNENTIIRPHHQRIQMKNLPVSRLVIIDGAGHAMFGEKPTELQAAVRECLGQ